MAEAAYTGFLVLYKRMSFEGDRTQCTTYSTMPTIVVCTEFLCLVCQSHTCNYENVWKMLAGALVVIVQVCVSGPVLISCLYLLLSESLIDAWTKAR